MLEIRNLTIQLDRDGRYLVKNLTLSLAAGEKAVLAGEEGNGKSTLLKALLGQADWCRVTGDIRLDGPVGCLPQFLPLKDRWQISSAVCRSGTIQMS